MRWFWQQYRWRIVILLAPGTALAGYRYAARDARYRDRVREWRLDFAEKQTAVRFERLRDLPISFDEPGPGIELDLENNLIRTASGSPYLAFPNLSFGAPKSVSHIRLRVRPPRPELAAVGGALAEHPDFRLSRADPRRRIPARECYLWYVPARLGMPEFEHVFEEKHRASGVVFEYGDESVIEWHLPKPASEIHLVLPADTNLRFLSLELIGPVPGPEVEGLSWSPLVGQTLLVCGFILLGVIVAQLVWRSFRPTATMAKGVLVGLIAVMAITFVFLLPPFQGPDERADWQRALELYRTDHREEVPLYNLHEIIRVFEEDPAAAERNHRWIAFRPHNAFPAELLRTEITDAVKKRHHNKAPTGVPGTGLWSYPSVGLVSLFFPHVETLNEALFFYYACRMLNALFLIAVLAWANRLRGLPYLGLCFFSLPLVVQQCVVISHDGLANVGTLLAVQLLFRLRDRFNPWLLGLLLATCATVALCKLPLYAGILMVLLFLIPYRRIPHKPLVFTAAFTALAVIGYFGLQFGVQKLAASADPGERANVEAHLADFAKRGLPDTVEQIRKIWWHQLMIRGMGDTWFQPLGYVDTEISELHRGLIYLSLAVALLLDLMHYLPGLFELSLARGLELAYGLSAGLANLAFVSAASAMSMYLLYSGIGELDVSGLQVRYWFPAAILMIFLPITPLRAQEVEATVGPIGGGYRIAVSTLALSLLPWLFFARQVELAIDLLIRYW